MFFLAYFKQIGLQKKKKRGKVGEKKTLPRSRVRKMRKAAKQSATDKEIAKLRATHPPPLRSTIKNLVLDILLPWPERGIRRFFFNNFLQHIHAQKRLLTKPATNNALTYNTIIVSSYNTTCLFTLVTICLPNNKLLADLRQLCDL